VLSSTSVEHMDFGCCHSLAAAIDSQFMKRKVSEDAKLYTRQNDETEYMFMLGAPPQRQYVVDHNIGHFFFNKNKAKSYVALKSD